MSNKNQSEDSLSASTLRTRRRTYLKERPADVIRPKKAAKDSNKPKGPQIEEESLREHARRELVNPTENLIMSTSMATGVLGMPAPGLKQAPEFDSRNPEELKEFLEEFEELTERHGLTTKEKTKIVVKYVDKETKKFWKRLEGYRDNYAILKRKIMGAYSKTLLEDKPTVAKLVKLVKKSAKGSIHDEEDLDTIMLANSSDQNQANYLCVSIDKENSIRVLARFLSTYIQMFLFTDICTYA